MNSTVNDSPLPGNVATLLRGMAQRDSPLLDRALELLFGVLDERGTCIRLDALGEPSQVRDELLATGIAGAPGAWVPLIIDGDFLYPQRYHHYETSVAQALRTLLETPAMGSPTVAGLPAKAFARGVAFITGGPGTGKTTAVARVLAAIADGRAEPASVCLLAPTGKAAARLSQSVGAGLPAGSQERLRISSGTIHRMPAAGASGTAPVTLCRTMLWCSTRRPWSTCR